MKAPVVIVPYHPEWPGEFEKERTRLQETFASTNAAIEHVGSTAVPGLAAKPVIDIMVGVAALWEVEARIDNLRAEGYEYVPAYEAQLPQRRYFRKPLAEPRTHHVHCVLRESSFWHDQLAFRDYLRTSPTAARAYATLKRDLASRYAADREAYSGGKSDFIMTILAHARTGTPFRAAWHS
ncbi:MAG TPA: GrpB family protein [Gemmatimonadaceae bacterium]|nr:GrpB family protein [Gemmatimonadaceae bacterium]